MSNRFVATGISLVEMSRRPNDKGELDGNDEFGIAAMPNRPTSPVVSMQLVALVATLLLLTAISVVAIVYVLRARVFVIVFALFTAHTCPSLH